VCVLPFHLPVNRTQLTHHVKSIAQDLGFGPVGITTADPPGHWEFYRSWIDKGYAGEMGYLKRNLEKREDPKSLVPGAKSIICVGLNYLPLASQEARHGPTGQVSLYARGDDYHDVMKKRLIEFQNQITDLLPGTKGRAYVDTGPVLEREFAARAGVGWFGKHTNLIHKRSGSWFFIGELILTADLVPDPPATDHCGTCTKCIEACPTHAILEPYVLDSKRCISYLSIELKGPIPKALRPAMGDWVYGCDICQDVCPWNQKHAQPTNDPVFQSRPGLDSPELAGLLAMDQEEFSRRFRKSPIKRTKRRGLLRNAAVALGNVGSTDDIPILVVALQDNEPLVRSHAAWALGQIGGEDASVALVEREKQEDEVDVLREIQEAIIQSELCGRTTTD
jgi:epoxyqueuosine reductase